MKSLIEDIKKLSQEQLILKNQRKTVNLKSERKLEPWKAVLMHTQNRNRLRILYAALGQLRGKLFSEIENAHPEEGHPLSEFSNQINSIIEKYTNEEAIHSY